MNAIYGGTTPERKYSNNYAVSQSHHLNEISGNSTSGGSFIKGSRIAIINSKHT